MKNGTEAPSAMQGVENGMAVTASVPFFHSALSSIGRKLDFQSSKEGSIPCRATYSQQH